MTKKCLHTVSSSKIKEFLIPNIFENKSQLIGIKTGEEYEFGEIVYTGVELTVPEILKKPTEHRSINLLKRLTGKKTLNNYLLQIKGIKIGKQVSINAHFQLTEKK